MNTTLIEYCFLCEEPTGKAGINEDSLYGEDGRGPYCEACWAKHTDLPSFKEDWNTP